MNHPEKTLKENLQKAKGTVWIESTQIRWFSRQSDRRVDLVRGGQRRSKTKLAQGGPSSLSPQGQIIALVIARREAGPCER